MKFGNFFDFLKITEMRIKLMMKVPMNKLKHQNLTILTTKTLVLEYMKKQNAAWMKMTVFAFVTTVGTGLVVKRAS